jgi:hypothetical protein
LSTRDDQNKEREVVVTLSSTKAAQNRAVARWSGSAGRTLGPVPDQASSMYCTMTCDSGMALPSWRRTGTFLWTGLEARRSSPLLCRSSSTYS